MKYRSVKTECRHGHTHSSKKEANRCNELNLLQRAGKITGLSTQRPYDIYVNDQKICRYVADFFYTEIPHKLVVEDTKGYKTPEYRLKAKLMLAIYGIEILET